ncbi:putative glutamine amidotransferase-like protein C13C5.04 [Polychaeton citri CBS 116435]|uniref:Glutamine amidotransferase-like protein C13C5.04 n=1 Tax=Polychaeton citri CBS 116435 TaxID=1314669 RepID=A0A9P4ULV9_9PEZI|nr:putative glutamine amidotransferase-like protein C13C5.04 [Polychaeton citri CBS 116435]
MARLPVKILVLETDEPHPDTKEERGRFSDIFHHLFKAAGYSHDPPLDVETDMHYVVDDPEHGHHGHVPSASEIPQEINAILITGSMYDAHGDDPWIRSLMSLIIELWRTRSAMKFSGVCFGHQLLNRTLGAKVKAAESGKWELSHTEMNLTSVGQKLFRTNDTTISVHQMHQDHVETLPSHQTSDLLLPSQKVHNWASTDHTEIQGVYIRDRLFTSQGHLGFDEAMVRRQIELRQDAGSIDEDDKKEVAYADETAHLEHEGEVVAAAILRFFHGDDHEIE